MNKQDRWIDKIKNSQTKGYYINKVLKMHIIQKPKVIHRPLAK